MYGSSSLLPFLCECFSFYVCRLTAGPFPWYDWLPVAPGNLFISSNQQALTCTTVPICKLSSIWFTYLRSSIYPWSHQFSLNCQSNYSCQMWQQRKQSFYFYTPFQSCPGLSQPVSSISCPYHRSLQPLIIVFLILVSDCSDHLHQSVFIKKKMQTVRSLPIPDTLCAKYTSGTDMKNSLLINSLYWKSCSEFQITYRQNFCWIVQSLSRVQLSVTPWTAALQASLSFTISQHLLKIMDIELVMPSNHLILCGSLLLLPSVFPSIRVFPVNQLFTSGGQSIGASASASVLPVNIQGN